MEYRVFNKTKEKVSLLGFGAMRFPVLDNSIEKIDEKTACEMIDYAIANGVNYFDTAYIYHEGKSEVFLAKALAKYPRSSYFLADKLPLWWLKTREEAEKIFAEQLKRCNTEYFDYYLLHAMTKDKLDLVVNLGLYDLLKEYQKQGKIKNLGFSFHDSNDVLELIINRYDWDFVQIQVNYLDWEVMDAKRLYEITEKKGVQCIIMEPVKGGTLATLCPEACEILKTAQPEKSVASWAIRYVASLPNVLTVLSGMSDFSQVKDNINSMTPFKPLSDSERSVLADALNAYKKSNTIPCTACRYCMDCPSGVDIPGVFKIINDYALIRDSFAAKDAVNSLAPEARPEYCTECGVCMEHCPQSINIPEQMKKADKIFKELLK
jgi:predicted aldo/keto reductase-like oxidoreductase